MGLLIVDLLGALVLICLRKWGGHKPCQKCKENIRLETLVGIYIVLFYVVSFLPHRVVVKIRTVKFILYTAYLPRARRIC